VTLHLVRHGRPRIVRGRPAHEWELDPAGFDDVWVLRDSGRLPSSAEWFSSTEPKAAQTAQLLTDNEISVVSGLRELVRDSTTWHDDFPAVVRRAFDAPDEAAAPGWETVAQCRERVVAAVAGIRRAHPTEPLVLVGHGTAWTLLAAALTGTTPDLERWQRMPDVIEVDAASV
jgi:broad specificity phosphatase PhoE